MTQFNIHTDKTKETPRRRQYGKNMKEHLYARDNALCGICGEYLPFDEVNIDHIVPYSANGADTEDNLRIAHKSCNSMRGPHLVSKTARMAITTMLPTMTVQQLREMAPQFGNQDLVMIIALDRLYRNGR